MYGLFTYSFIHCNIFLIVKVNEISGSALNYRHFDFNEISVLRPYLPVFFILRMVYLTSHLNTIESPLPTFQLYTNNVSQLINNHSNWKHAMFFQSKLKCHKTFLHDNLKIANNYFKRFFIKRNIFHRNHHYFKNNFLHA